MIQVLKRNEIDTAKYDACILAAANKTVYALSWYLDVVSPGWSVAVVDNYTVVMPIPIKNKFGIRYALQPLYSQQLGIYSPQPIDKELAKALISKLPFFYILNFNFGNNQLINNAKNRTNYILNLNTNFSNIASKYSKDLQRNINKAIHYDQHLTRIDKKEFVSFYKQHSGEWLNEKHVNILEQLLIAAEKQKVSEIVAVRNTDEEVIAAIFFINSCNRLYSLVTVSNSEGYKKQSVRFLLNSIIEEKCGQDLLLDFEGSELPGVKKFFKDFGGTNQQYPSISRNAWLFKKLSFRKRQ